MPESQYAVFQDALTIPTVVRPSRPAFRCLEAVYWAVLKHTCLRPESQPLDAEDDNHSYKHQYKDEGLSDLIKFDTLKPSWLDKIDDSLIYIAFNCNNKMTQYELSLNPIWWRIINLSDPMIMTLMLEDVLLELNTKFSSLLKNWTILELEAERCLQFFKKMNDKINVNLSKIDENNFNKENNEDYKKILLLTLKDYTNPDIAFIFNLIQY
ncbi:21562_t:CDS:2, partial [Gigaspora margarita]